MMNRHVMKPTYLPGGFGPMRSDRGVTLLELLVVLVILTATALIVIPTLTVHVETPLQAESTPNEVVTAQIMTAVRDAMVGEDGVLENLAFQPPALPRQIADLVEVEPPENLQQEAPELAKHDPRIGIGWQGPYFLANGRNKEGRPSILDAWGNELALQVDFDQNGQVDQQESLYIRVVSPGPNGRLETPVDPNSMKPGRDESRELTLDKCGDDLVFFLRVPDNRQ